MDQTKAQSLKGKHNFPVTIVAALKKSLAAKPK
jgi:hypothetical protein